MTRRYTSEIINEIGPEKDIPAPDVGTDSQVMAWIFDTYSMNMGHSVLGVVTGKPLAIGGSVGRTEATARGALYCIRTAIMKQGGRLDGTRVAVQGFGNVGSNLARLLADEGARVVAISDSTGGVANPYGIDVRAAIAHKGEHGVLTGLPGTEGITNQELIEYDCDVFAPCALEQVVNEENAGNVKARIVAEGANGPLTPAADEILDEKGVLVLPDVLVNAGGVVVSYFEWVQGLQEYFWKEYEVNAKLNDIVVRAFEETWQTRERFGTSMRHGRLRPRHSARVRGDDHARPLSLDRPRAFGTVWDRSRPMNGRDRATDLRPQGAPSPVRAGVEVVESVRAEVAFELELVDIGGDPELEARYRVLLPVIEIDGEPAFTFVVDAAELRARVS